MNTPLIIHFDLSHIRFELKRVDAKGRPFSLVCKNKVINCPETSICGVLRCSRPVATTIGRALLLQRSGARDMMRRWTQPLARGAHTVVQCCLELISAPLKSIYIPRPILQSSFTDGGSTSGKWIIKLSLTHQVRILPTELIRMKWHGGKLMDGLIPFRDFHHERLSINCLPSFAPRARGT